MHTHFYIIMPSFGTFWTPVRYPDDEMPKEAVWRDRQKISILVELTGCQKNVANALNSVGIILKNKVYFVAFPFFFIVKLQNFLNAPRTNLIFITKSLQSLYLWNKTAMSKTRGTCLWKYLWCVDACPCNDFVMLRRVRNYLHIIIIIIIHGVQSATNFTRYGKMVTFCVIRSHYNYRHYVEKIFLECCSKFWVQIYSILHSLWFTDNKSADVNVEYQFCLVTGSLSFHNTKVLHQSVTPNNRFNT